MTQASANTALIDAARKKWVERLIDLSRRNNLLYFRDTKTGSLDLTSADPKPLETLLAGDKISLRAFRPDLPADETRERIAGVSKRTLLNLEEKGLQTLYVALGMAAWPARDKGRPSRSAVVLLPVKLDAKGLPPSMQRAGPPQINLALLHILESEFGCVLSADALLAGLFDEREPVDAVAANAVAANAIPGALADVDAADTPGPLTDLAIVLDRVREACRRIEGFKVEDAAVLSNFSFQKMAMVRDIQGYADQIASHRILSAMAGDVPARVALQSGRQDVALDTLDRTPADQEFMVLDADSSQQRVIASVARMQDGVIQGPPGTGKSQTIVNLIATLAAQGKRVLFVAEKRAALQVVYDRLHRIGLDSLVLDLHGADVSSRQIYDRIAVALSAMRDVPAVNSAQPHEQFQNRRGKLNQHVAALHKKRPPLGLSAFDLQGKLVQLPLHAATAVRFREADLERFTPDAVQHVRDLLTEGGGFAGLLLETDPSPWTKAVIGNGTELANALDLVNALHGDLLPRLKRLLDGIGEQAPLKRPSTLKDALVLSKLLDETGEAFARYNPGIFEQPLEAFAAELTPVATGLKRLIAKLTRSSYRHAVRTLRAMRLAPADEAQLRTDATQLHSILLSWRSLSTDTSQLPEQLAEQAPLHQCIIELVPMSELQRYVPGKPVLTMPIEELEASMAALANDVTAPRQLLRVRQVQRELSGYKLSPLLAVFEKAHTPADEWCDAFDSALWRSHLDRIWMEAPELGAFRGERHQQIVDEFKRLDRARTELAVQRVKRLQAELALKVRNQFPEENLLVKSQIQRKRRRMPLRDLLAQAPNVLTAIFPCWMASPLSISQLLKADRRYFDIVIFDEASQILPEDAVPAIMRAEHVVVAGDRNQLPPTTFFAAGSDDEGDDEDNANTAVDGYESILDLMTGISEAWSLDWHYRSKDESLIAFSNRHIYQDRMVTFPGATLGAAITHVLVDHHQPHDAETQSVSAEVNRVVELVLEHARTRPHETLGVITMGIAHADRIQRVLDVQVAQYPELNAFFDISAPERFFVKNLERVQGDERDAIIISIGYGKDASGRLPYRFGPLLTQGGERRLNVAVTRARSRLTLVSSFSHHDMDPSRTKARGVELLRLYLEYAASHGRTLSRSENGHGQPTNPFEADVYNALSVQGMKLIPQWGVSSYRIDFAAQHPDEPGRFVLAIECDGATYHSAPTARDRDRLRQQVLASLGWRFHRIWSTDWFNNRDAEIQRAVAAYRDACAVNVQPKLPASDPQPQAAPIAAATFAKATPMAEVSPVRARRPRRIQPDGRPIDNYTMAQLVSIVHWVQSDGKLHDDEELFAEVYQELGYKRRGDRITSRIRAAIEQAKLKRDAAG